MSILADRLIHLSTETARAQVYPERGLQLFGFQVLRGRDWVEAIYAPRDAIEPADRRYGNPVLFPAVDVSNAGQPDSWLLEGANLPMPSHGWARNVYWQIEQASSDAVTAVLVPHPGFRLAFPFDFDLRITYSLQSDQLVLDCVLRNLGMHAFPYAFGLHPYLRSPLQAGEVARCLVDLPRGTRLRSEDGWRSIISEPFAARTLAVNDSLLPGSIVLADTRLTWLQVRDEEAGLATRVSVEGSEEAFPVWVAWASSPNAGYVCLEPWTDAPNALNRSGTRQLASGQVHRYRMSISVHSL